MWRILVEPGPLFVMGVLAVSAYLMVRRLYPVPAGHWSRTTVPLVALLALAAVVLALLALGLFADRHKGAYVPAHIENGKLLPGSIQ